MSIQTSPNDRLLWALDNRGSVFVRTGLSDEMPVGTEWELVPGTHLCDVITRLHLSVCECVSLCVCVGLAVSQLVLSCRTAWVRCVNGDLARRYGVSERNPAGDYWKKIPGNASWFTGKTGLFCFILVHRYLTQLCLRCVSPSLQSLQRMSCGQ